MSRLAAGAALELEVRFVGPLLLGPGRGRLGGPSLGYIKAFVKKRWTTRGFQNALKDLLTFKYKGM